MLMSNLVPIKFAPFNLLQKLQQKNKEKLQNLFWMILLDFSASQTLIFYKMLNHKKCWDSLFCCRVTLWGIIQPKGHMWGGIYSQITHSVCEGVSSHWLKKHKSVEPIFHHMVQQIAKRSRKPAISSDLGHL